MSNGEVTQLFLVSHVQYKSLPAGQILLCSVLAGATSTASIMPAL